MDDLFLTIIRSPLILVHRYLNFFSNHPLEHKKNVIGQLDRILFLSHSKFHEKNIISLINILQKNGYPLEFLFATINN